MKKTRIFAVLAAMAMGLAVFGCSNGDSDSSESGSTGGSASGGGTPGGSASGSDSESDTTGGTASGSIEPVLENFVKISGASIDGTEKWTPESEIFISRRKFKIASFYMSDHEVTRGEYKDVMGSDPSTYSAYDKDGKELTGDAAKNNPVNNVSWYDALVYCNTRSIKENLTPCYAIGGKTDPKDWGSVPDEHSDDTEYEKWDAVTCDFTADGYRLPTEAEWEWAARGGESYTYAGSDNISEVAWYCSFDSDANGTRDVKSKMANGYGLYDMSGNVSEWCWDMGEFVYHDTPTAGSNDKDWVRSCRGDGMIFSEDNLQVAYRDFWRPYNSHGGFRLVHSAPDSTEDSPSYSILSIPEVFVQIPGTSIDGTEKWYPDSKVFVSGRKLEIASFQMSDHEVTRGEYKAVMGSDPSTAKAYGNYGENELTGDDAVKNNPVNYISWYDALVYCNTRSIKEGLTPCYTIGGKTDPKDWGSVPDEDSDYYTEREEWSAVTCDFTADGYRLPTEAEWEWAARGGEKIYNERGDEEIIFARGKTKVVMSEKANAYGLYDMDGNVLEWCWDWFSYDTGEIDSYFRGICGGGLSADTTIVVAIYIPT